MTVRIPRGSSPVEIRQAIQRIAISYFDESSDVDHDATTNFEEDEHIDHTAVIITAGTGLTGGGDISSNMTISLSHLSIENLSDPGGDRILFWDDSETACKWLSPDGTTVAITDTTLSIVAGGVDHGSLGGLSDDDHTQYFLADGSRSISGEYHYIPYAGYDFLFTYHDVYYPGRTGLAIQGQTSGNAPFLDWFSKDGDSTDDIGITMWIKGVPRNTSNSEVFEFRWDHTSGDATINTGGSGSHSTRPIAIYTEGNDPQIYLKTDGTVGIGTDTPSTALDVNGDITGGNVTSGEDPGHTHTSGSITLLGIESLSDPDVDKIIFWDESETACKWLEAGTGLSISSTTISVVDSDIDHGSIGGLSDDDHTQYYLLNGTRALTGNMDIATYKIYTTTTNGDIIIEPDGTGAFQTSSTGSVRGSYAVDLQRDRATSTHVAAGSHSVICGGINNITGNYGAILSGNSNAVSGIWGGIFTGIYNVIGVNAANSVICSGNSNVIYSENCAIIGGNANRISSSSSYSTICGGQGNQTFTSASSFIGSGYHNYIYSTYNGIICGRENLCSGNYSIVVGGYLNYIDNSTYCFIGGGNDNRIETSSYAFIPGGTKALASRYAELAHASGSFVNRGDAQHSVLIARIETSATDQVQMYLDGAGGASSMIVYEDQVWYYTIKILATETGTPANSYTELIEGVIYTDGGTTIHDSGPTVIRTQGISLGTITVDDPDNELRIQVTPSATNTTRWVAVIDIVQLSIAS